MTSEQSNIEVTVKVELSDTRLEVALEDASLFGSDTSAKIEDAPEDSGTDETVALEDASPFVSDTTVKIEDQTVALEDASPFGSDTKVKIEDVPEDSGTAEIAQLTVSPHNASETSTMSGGNVPPGQNSQVKVHFHETPEGMAKPVTVGGPLDDVPASIRDALAVPLLCPNKRTRRKWIVGALDLNAGVNVGPEYSNCSWCAWAEKSGRPCPACAPAFASVRTRRV